MKAVKVFETSVAVVTGALRLVDALRSEAKPAPETQLDGFQAGAAADTSPRRPSEAALRFIAAFERDLGLDAATRAKRVEFMRSSTNAYFRANPALFDMDVRQAYEAPLLGRPSPTGHAVGDMHLGNFGTLKGPKGRTVWTVNDLDQARIAPLEEDLKQLGASTVLIARAQGQSPAAQRELAALVAEAYLDGLMKPGQPYVKKKAARGDIKALVKKADDKTRKDMLERWTLNGRFRDVPRLQRVDGELGAQLREAVELYAGQEGSALPIARPVEILDVARRLDAGGSTLGLDRFYVLVAGKGKKPARIIELKQAPAPWEEGSPTSANADPAAAMAASKAMLGFVINQMGSATVGGRTLMVREREPQKGSVDAAGLLPHRLPKLVKQAGSTLARAHARTHHEALLAWVGKDKKLLTKSLADFSVRYANQVEADYRAFCAQPA